MPDVFGTVTEKKKTKLLEAFIRNGPLHLYEIETDPSLEVKHSTAHLWISNLLRDGYIRLHSEKASKKNGLMTKKYEAVPKGTFHVLIEKVKYHPLLSHLFHLDPADNGQTRLSFDKEKQIPWLYPQDNIWTNVRFLIKKNPAAWAFIPKEQYEFFDANEELLRALILACIDQFIVRNKFSRIGPDALDFGLESWSTSAALYPFILTLFSGRAESVLTDGHYVEAPFSARFENYALRARHKNRKLFEKDMKLLRAQANSFLELNRYLIPKIQKSLSERAMIAKLELSTIDRLKEALGSI